MKLTMPMFFGMFVQTIYNVVDTIFIGHYVGSLGIAGLSISFPIQMLTMGIGSMVGVGGASLISRLIGGGGQRQAERALGNGITFSIIFSVLLMIIILPSVNFLLKLIGASENVLPLARDYLVIITSGAAFNIVSSVLLYFVRAEGNARVGMTTMILCSVLNIILDAVFIILLGMGVKGAALATVISQIVALIYVLSYYLTGSSYLKIRTSNFAPDLKILKSIFTIGIASFVQTIAGSVSAMFLIRMAVTYGGDIAISAFGIIQRIMMFSSIPGMVLGQGMQPVLGFNYGAKRYNQALKAITIPAVASMIFGMAAFLVLFFIPEPIIKIFSTDTQLVTESIFAARRVFLVLPLFGFYNVGSLVFPSIGKAIESFIIAVARPVLFLTPLVLILPRYWQLNGVWLSFPGADVLTFLLTLALLIPLIRRFQKAAAIEKRGKTIPVIADSLSDSMKK
jgi:putative MATE family efflux protein